MLRESEYQNQTDEALIEELRNGQPDITDYIMEKYKYLVRRRANAMFLIGGDTDDLIQEGMIGLFKAIRDYDSGRDASFFSFADLCISRQMYTAVQASRRQKHAPLNSYISLYSHVASGNEQGEEAELVSILAAEAELSPEEMVIDRENVENVERAIERELSTFEKQVLDLHLTGMGYIQIAKVLGKDEKSADNALQRIKGKLRKAIG